MKTFLIIPLLLAASAVHAQQYLIDSYKIGGDTGTSTGGTYQVSGTIGQPDDSSMFTTTVAVPPPNIAIQPLQYVLAGYTTNNNPTSIHYGSVSAYYSLVSVLAVWPSTGSYTLQTNNNLNPSNWIAYGGAISNTNGSNSAVITPLTGNLFFRLSNP